MDASPTPARSSLRASGVAVHDAIAGRGHYSVPRGQGEIDLFLDANEGSIQWPGLEDVVRDSRVMHRYPSTASLEAKIAARFGVSPAQVVVTAGGDDALDRACRMTLSSQRSLVLPEPSFEMFRRYAEIAGATVRSVPWLSGRFPIEDVLASFTPGVGAVAIVSPNNPTGAVASAGDVAAVCAQTGDALVIVDAAYAEFADEDLTSEALRHRNAIVVRTFSKAWGLAGLRVGYAIGPEDLIGCLRAAGGPYPVSGLSLSIASVLLDRGEQAMRESVALVRANRARLAASLIAIGLRVSPSQGNFLLARTEFAGRIHAGLAARGIAVRRWTNRPELRDALRITVPAIEHDLARLTSAFESILKNGDIR